MLIVVDYKCGNIGSICNMLKKVGAGEVRVSSSPADIAAASRLILPGVGSFDAGMTALRKGNLESALNEKVLERRTPILGICLGMQLLFEGSEEGVEPGLGWVKGVNKRFDLPSGGRLKVPHMGWNTVEPAPGSRMFAGQPEEFGFYFVHSYYAKCDNESVVAGWTRHGVRFAAAVEQGNIWGVQFHPEKSHRHGMQLLKNFLETTGNA